jgi:hypothetical protein
MLSTPADIRVSLPNIQKTVTTVFQIYHVEAVDAMEDLHAFGVGIARPLLCKLSFWNPQPKLSILCIFHF